jgi:hypothetical protein
LHLGVFTRVAQVVVRQGVRLLKAAEFFFGVQMSGVLHASDDGLRGGRSGCRVRRRAIVWDFSSFSDMK